MRYLVQQVEQSRPGVTRIGGVAHQTEHAGTLRAERALNQILDRRPPVAADTTAPGYARPEGGHDLQRPSNREPVPASTKSAVTSTPTS